MRRGSDTAAAPDGLHLLLQRLTMPGGLRVSP